MFADETDPELALLGGGPGDPSGEANQAHRTAPIITGDAFDAVGPTIFPQRALYGRILETSTGAPVKSAKLYINTNAPFSGIVCGVQGSGKSHSTSVLLESCLICDKRLGSLPEPLSALLFYFDTAGSAGELPPCEAACIASLEATRRGDATPPKVVVLVLPNNLNTMRRAYVRLPEVNVEPLHFAPEDLNGERILAMMKVEQDQHIPLYMECIMSILRGMDTFSYEEFRRQLKEQKFLGTQKTMLDLRLNILDSCLEGGNTSNCVSKHFKKGQLTIIDLSSPFMDAASACGFFDIILGLFIQCRPAASGKLVVLDEAHKYLTSSGTSSRLTDSLLRVIRQQRHLGTRVLISTQEPTVVPSSFLDLCSFVIAHRFSSQKWLDHLKEHISIVDTRWGSKVINLKLGEAMIFSPSALVLRPVPPDQDASHEAAFHEAVALMGQGYLIVRSRERITVDGGRSVLATEPTLHAHSVSTSDEGSTGFSPKSVAEDLETPRSWEDQHDIGQERPRMSDYPDSVSHLSSTDSKLVAWASSSHIPDVAKGSTPATMLAASTNVAVLISARNVEVQRPQATTAGCSYSPGPAPSIGLKAAPPVNPEIWFQPLISVLKKNARKGQYQIFLSELGTVLPRLQHAPNEELEAYVREAEEANMVETDVSTRGLRYVQLVDTGSQWCPRREYVPLVKAMWTFLDIGEERPTCGEVAQEIYRTHPGSVRVKFKTYISGAEAASVVVRRKKDRIQLAHP